MDQKSIQKGIGKRIQKRNDFSMVLGIFLGGVPRTRRPGAGIVRPPKDQTPLELGKCLGLGKGKGLGTGKHKHKGMGKDTGQVDRMTHSRRRAKRGGGYNHSVTIISSLEADGGKPFEILWNPTNSTHFAGISELLGFWFGLLAGSCAGCPGRFGVVPDKTSMEKSMDLTGSAAQPVRSDDFLRLP